jgi:hypothetical protein
MGRPLRRSAARGRDKPLWVNRGVRWTVYVEPAVALPRETSDADQRHAQPPSKFQWGEVAWRHDILSPPERFENGAIRVSERPGLGVELNEKVVRAHLM